jgi:hypothetical protein
MKIFNKIKNNNQRVRDVAEEYMRLKEEELSNRLQMYSDSTVRLISEIMLLSKEDFRKGRDIVTNSKLSEEEVVNQLTELKENSIRRKFRGKNNVV